MLNGIEVFTKSEIIKPNTTFGIIAIIFFIIAILFLFISSRFQNHDYYTVSSVLSLIGLISVVAACISFLLFMFCVCPKKTGKYEYKVRINDTVTVKELYKNYNVTNYDKKNDIFIIEDK